MRAPKIPQASPGRDRSLPQNGALSCLHPGTLGQPSTAPRSCLTLSLVLNLSLAALADDGSSMVQLPGGTFRMGSGSLQRRGEEEPPREVTLKPFALDKHPVTNRDFR